MKRRAGFTIIELLITITVMVILITLAVVSLRANQVNARDDKRKSDVTVIAQQLESYYDSGSNSTSFVHHRATVAVAHPRTTLFNAQLATCGCGGGGATPVYSAGSYPPGSYLNTEDGVRAALRDIDPQVLRAPDVAASSPMSLTIATDANTPAPNTSAYVYQPLTSTGALCADDTTECVKFNIYYTKESDNSVQKVTSNHQ